MDKQKHNYHQIDTSPDRERHAYRGRAHGHGGKHGRGRGDGARRGEARYILLDALHDSPKHGYEIIKVLEERSSGQYTPSPGTVYPTLQYLEDMGMVQATQEMERRVYHLTETGQAELKAHAEEIADFWARFSSPASSPASQVELGFLQEEMDYLAQTVWGGLRNAPIEDSPEMIRRVRQAIQDCRNEVRRIMAIPPNSAEKKF
jgi:DNA-binding PadR family transcriptional regulator